MLNLRLYRAAWLPVLFVLLLVAFSLESPPRAIPTTFAPDAFDGTRAARTVEGLARAYPDRRPGSVGDEELADRVREGFVRAFGAERVRERHLSARTIDGERELRTVIAERPGRSERRIVVLAHRDAAGHEAKAELSATGGLLELAQVFRGGVTRRTLTLVSVSGGSGGAAGARDFAAHPGGPVDAIIVLGDLAGTATHKPWVVPWSNARGSAPLRLQRTAELSVREETNEAAGASGAAMQYVRLAFPFTVGEQGPLNAERLPAVLLGPGGELGPTADTPVEEERMRQFGRAALRTVTALDNGRDIEPEFTSGVVVRGSVVPPWAVRLLVGVLLLPALLGALDGLFRVRRRREPAGRWALWALCGALPLLLVTLFAVALRAVGLLGSAPAAPLPPGAVDVGWVALLFAVLMLVAGWVLVRRAAVRRLVLPRRPTTAGAAAGVAVVAAVAVGLVWLRNPYAAGVLVPAVHLWLLAVAPEVRVSRPVAVGLVVAGLLPLALAVLAYGVALGAGPVELAWLALLAVAGGHASPLGIALGAVVLGCAASALVVARYRTGPTRRPSAPESVATRGPLTYAGPGSLGGTESALRR